MTIQIYKGYQEGYTPFQIYGKPGCTYCDQAKALLQSKGIPYSYLTLGEDYSLEELLELVPSAKTVPQIWEGQIYIGGFDNLKSYFDFAGI